MVFARDNTYDLQQLVHVLQIDPENVRIESPRLTSTKMSSLISSAEGNKSPGGNNSVVESKAMPLRVAAKRRSSQDSPTPVNKERKREMETYTRFYLLSLLFLLFHIL